MDKLYRVENVYIPRVADLPPEASTVKEILLPQGIQSLIVIPLVYGGSLIGYLGFDSVRTEKRWSEESIALLKIVGEIFVNVLKRKKAEEALAKALAEREDIMESVPDIIYTLDLNGNVVGWNRKLETVTGLSAEELMGKPAVEFFAGEDRAAVAKAIRKRLGTGYLEGEGSIIGKDGKPIPYLWSIASLKDAQGNVVGLTGVGRDITERKRAYEEHERLLNELKAKNAELQKLMEHMANLEEVTRMKSDFLSILNP